MHTTVAIVIRLLTAVTRLTTMATKKQDKTDIMQELD